MAVQSELIPTSMQHISSFARIQGVPSTIINNRDKRLTLLGSIIMIISLAVLFWVFPIMTTHAEAPTDTATIIPTTDSVSIIDTVSKTLGEVSLDILPSTPKLVDGLTVEQRAAKIDAFFLKKGNLPATGKGIIFVTYADKYGLDWRLVASKVFIESTGFKFACKNDKYNGFGWGSCRGEKFDSYEDAIETVTRNLSGGNPNTAMYYKDKTIDEIIDAYNPPSVRANYKKLIKGTMANIDKMDIAENSNQLARK